MQQQEILKYKFTGGGWNQNQAGTTSLYAEMDCGTPYIRYIMNAINSMNSKTLENINKTKILQAPQTKPWTPGVLFAQVP